MADHTVTDDLMQYVPEDAPEKDLWETKPLPPKGRYLVRVSLGEEGVVRKLRMDKDTKEPLKVNGKPVPYIQATVQLKITAGEYENSHKVQTVFFDRPNTIVFDPERNTSLGDLMYKIQRPFKAGSTLAEREEHVRNALAVEPLVGLDLDWEAVDPDDGYKAFHKTMKAFPVDPENGGHSCKTINPKTQEEVWARAKIVKYVFAESVQV